jgi:hypothetical protein
VLNLWNYKVTRYGARDLLLRNDCQSRWLGLNIWVIYYEAWSIYGVHVREFGKDGWDGKYLLKTATLDAVMESV